MSDLNMMLREQARNGLQAQLDVAVTNGDTEAARKITADIEKLAVTTAPKAPPFGDAEIRAELDKQPWFGVDPKKSAKAVEFGKTLDPKKFSTAAAFADALVKAVDAEFTPPTAAGAGTANIDADTGDGETGDDAETGDAGTATASRKKATDGPGDGEPARSRRAPSPGPWVKLSDAPTDVQKEVKRAADKFVSAGAPKEQREKFIAKTLESHYAIHQRSKGRK